MVNTRNQTRNDGSDDRIPLRSAPNQGSDEGSAFHNQNPLPEDGRQQTPTPIPNPPAVTFDAATMETFRALIVQIIQGMNQVTPPVAPETVLGDPTNNVGGNQAQATFHNISANFSRALKTFNSMRPDSYDGTDEPVKMAYWFSHMERLFRGIVCTEIEKVHIASLQLKEGASEWWESTGLADHPELSWERFKNKMMDRFFSVAMREEKLKEFLYPEVEGLSVTERAFKFNHLLHYAGSEVSSEQQKIMRFHEWMGPTIKPLLVRHGCSTLEEYVDLAYKLEVTLEESAKKVKGQQKSTPQGQSFGGFKRPAPPTNFEKSSRAKTEMTQSRTTQNSSYQRGSIVCYNCGKQGHISSNCLRDKKTCFNCGKEGHVQTFCPQKRLGADQSQQASVVHSNRVPAYPTRSTTVPATTQDKGKAPVASSSQGQQLYMMYQPNVSETL